MSKGGERVKEEGSREGKRGGSKAGGGEGWLYGRGLRVENTCVVREREWGEKRGGRGREWEGIIDDTDMGIYGRKGEKEGVQRKRGENECCVCLFVC